MAEAQVTVKLTVAELDLLRYALRATIQQRKAEYTNVAIPDRHKFTEKSYDMSDLLDKLGG